MFKLSTFTLAMTTMACACDRAVTISRDARDAEVAQATVASEPAERTSYIESKDGTKIAYEQVGNGQALVIVGGALSDRKGAVPLANELMANYSVYTYDRRGRGDSGDTQPYALAREVEDLAALIEKAGNQTYVFGVSSGAALALHAANELEPQAIAKLAVYEPPYGQLQAEFDAQKDRVNQLIESGKPGDAATYFLQAIGMPKENLEQMKQSAEWKAIAEIDFTLAYDYVVLGNGQVPASFERITIPTLVIDGGATMPFIARSADLLAETLFNARRTTLEGQTHQVVPEVVSPVLHEFFGD